MDPGTALAVVSLSFQLFAGCVKGFILISDAQNLGKDAALERMKLMLQEYRLVEWARAINLDSPQDDGSPGLNKHLAALMLGSYRKAHASNHAAEAISNQLCSMIMALCRQCML